MTEEQRKEIWKTFACLDCNVHTGEINEYYMVRNDIWHMAVPDHKGMLCIGCLEARLSERMRQTVTLNFRSFTFYPINFAPMYRKSERFISRLNNI
jgi:hypothetical protein